MSRVLGIAPRLPVADLKAAIEFYRTHLGFGLGTSWPEDAPTFALLTRDGISLQFFVPANQSALPSRTAAPDDRPMITLDVSDARAFQAQLTKSGVAVEWGPEVYWYGRREFAIRDPNGYLVILSEETSDPVTDEG